MLGVVALRGIGADGLVAGISAAHIKIISASPDIRPESNADMPVPNGLFGFFALIDFATGL